MPTDPITVEVVCAHGQVKLAGVTHCVAWRCGCDGVTTATLAPDSLAAAEIALARAVDREQQAYRQYLLHGEHEQVAKAWDAATEAVASTLAALRAHPEYRGDYD